MMSAGGARVIDINASKRTHLVTKERSRTHRHSKCKYPWRVAKRKITRVFFLATFLTCSPTHTSWEPERPGRADRCAWPLYLLPRRCSYLAPATDVATGRWSLESFSLAEFVRDSVSGLTAVLGSCARLAFLPLPSPSPAALSFDPVRRSATKKDWVVCHAYGLGPAGKSDAPVGDTDAYYTQLVQKIVQL